MMHVEADKPLNTITITVVDTPEVNLAPDEKTGELLLHFYRALGWNGVDIVDSCKIRTTKEVYNRLHDLMLEQCHDPVGVGMFLVNSGLGTEDYIPPGKVYLMEGWIAPAPDEGE
jgi:hypothetical protein